MTTRPITRYRPRRETDPRNMSGDQRSEYGVTITFQADNGDKLSLHGRCPVLQMVRALCAIALAKDESYRVVSCSTPASIFTDLQGSRRPADVKGTQGNLPEQRLLAGAGLSPLLHESVARWPR